MELSVKKIKEKLHNGSDLKERCVQFFSTQITLLYIADLVDNNTINNSILKPILEYKGKPIVREYEKQIQSKVLYNDEIEECQNEDEAIDKILKGFAVLVVDKANTILAINAEKIQVRAINIPPNSTVYKGPREGFVENYKTNLALIRQRLSSEKLATKSFEVGRLTKTVVTVCYLNGVASKKVVQDVEDRIKRIKIDGIVDSSYIVTFLQSKPSSMFKQVGDTEKPDILCAKLLEGRVAVVVDGSPIVLTVPFILMEDLQNSDDYYNQHIRITFVRILRLVSIILAILLPAVYLAVQLYHYKVIPLEFLVSIMNTTQGIPFTPFTEIVFVVLLFEVLYEVNLRMPQYLGMALSIVGALILGDTAVSAGLVSPPAVMIVALSGLTFYAVPNQASQFSILRLVFILLGAVLGLFGILIGTIGLLSYLCSMDSYDSPYLAPIAPYIKNDQKDFLLKKNLNDMVTRPKSIANNKDNLKRMKPKRNYKK